MVYNVNYAIKDIKNYIPNFIPEVGETQIFRLGYGRLKLWRATNDLIVCAFILPYKHDPLQDNLLFFTPDALIAECRK